MTITTSNEVDLYRLTTPTRLLLASASLSRDSIQLLDVLIFRGSSTIGEFSYFRNVTREIGDAPAFGFRVTSNSAAGQRASEQLRLIATKAWHQYDKLHVNLNLDTLQSTGFILGYSTPLGYPKKFDQSFLAEVAYQQKQASVGVGLRRQISAQSVLDFGVKAGRQARFTLGYTIGF
jgi:hypothetical protein